MRVLLFVLAALALTSALDLDHEWATFKKVYKKQYKNAEEERYRRGVWEYHLDFIQKHNLEADRGVHSFYLGVNEYADMPNEEFVAKMNGYKMRSEPTPGDAATLPPSNIGDLPDTVDWRSKGYVTPIKNQPNKEFVAKMNGYKMRSEPTPGGATFLPPSNIGDLPDTVDWRSKGYVTPIKNQGQCGSCWAFSTTGSLEGQHFKKYGRLVSLSEQNLVDCSWPEGNSGCEGGLMDQAFKYIKINKGIDTEASYPYEALDGNCRFKRADVGADDTGYVDIRKKNESDLKIAVATVGPISVAIDASSTLFQLYSHGVYYNFFCSQTNLDHGVLAVGYGNYEGKDYWLVKNSWGTSWGMKGYIMMSRNRRNNCGIATQASYPTV